VTRDEVQAAVRSAGCGDLADVAAVVLETDGSFSVIPKVRLGTGSALPSNQPDTSGVQLRESQAADAA
jgi:uncharacterized membrane protein YcaP (DUF421 family)